MLAPCRHYPANKNEINIQWNKPKLWIDHSADVTGSAHFTRSCLVMGTHGVVSDKTFEIAFRPDFIFFAPRMMSTGRTGTKFAENLRLGEFIGQLEG